MQQMFLGLGATAAAAVEHTVSNNDTNLNASTIFGSDFAADVPKIIIIPSGYEIGGTGTSGNTALTIPSGMGGTLEVQNAGTISGAGGAGGAGGSGGGVTGSGSPYFYDANYGDNGANGSAGGSGIYIASNNVTVTNSGLIRGGGGGGAGGDGGDGGGVPFTISGPWTCTSGGGGAGGAGGNGQGYNNDDISGSSGGGGGGVSSNFKGYAAHLNDTACLAFSSINQGSRNPWAYISSGNYYSYQGGQSGFTGGNGGAFGAAGSDGSGQNGPSGSSVGNNGVGSGGAAGKYIELAGGISYTLSNSGTLTGTAP